MDVAGAFFLIAVGFAMLLAGWRTRPRIIAGGGAANLVAGFLLLSRHGFGVLESVLLVVLLLGIVAMVDRETRRSISRELLSAAAAIVLVWTAVLLPATTPRAIQLLVIVLVALSAFTFIGLVVARVAREHFGEPLKR
jgi:NADH:ubiquinone oxidoreductase subunit K